MNTHTETSFSNLEKRLGTRSSSSISKNLFYLHKLNWSSINCFVGEGTCEKNGISIWTVGHFVFYTIVGAIVPGLYIEVLAISIFYEIFEQMVGHKPQYIIDPVVNMTGYILGSLLSKNK